MRDSVLKGIVEIQVGSEYQEPTLPHKTFGRACRLVGKSYFQLLNAVFSQMKAKSQALQKCLQML